MLADSGSEKYEEIASSLRDLIVASMLAAFKAMGCGLRRVLA
jgi:hypothetical protein